MKNNNNLNRKKIIEIEKLSKSFGALDVIKEISFSVYEGEIFGFIGQNGSGKSTLINMISTMLDITSGFVYIDGMNISVDDKKVREHIGIIFQQQTLDDNFSIYSNLKFHAKIYGMKDKNVINHRIDELLGLVGMAQIADKKIASLSGGQKRKVELIRAILHKPRILFLDEPTTGLDPHARIEIWDYILRLQREESMTVFLTTHYMDEIDYCNRVAIIVNGKINQIEKPNKLKESFSSSRIMFNTEKIKPIIKQAKLINKDIKYKVINEKKLEIEIPKDINVGIFISKLFKDNNYKIENLEIERPSMNNVFISIISKMTNEKDLKKIVSDFEEENLGSRDYRLEKHYKKPSRFVDEKMVKTYNEYINLKYFESDLETSKQKNERIIERSKLKDEYKKLKKSKKKSLIKSKEDKEKLAKNKEKIKETNRLISKRNIDLKIEKAKVYKSENVSPIKDSFKNTNLGSVFFRELKVSLTNRINLISLILGPLLMWILLSSLGILFGITFVESLAYNLPTALTLIPVMIGLFYGVSVLLDINNGFMKEMLVSPLHRWEIAVAKILSGSTQLLLPAIILFFAGLALPMGYEFIDIFAFILAFLFVSIAIVSISLSISLLVSDAKALNSILNIIIIPILILSVNTFTINEFIPWMMWFNLFNPITYINLIIYPILNTNSIQFESSYDFILTLPEEASVGSSNAEMGVWAGVAVILLMFISFLSYSIYLVNNFHNSKKSKNLVNIN